MNLSALIIIFVGAATVVEITDAQFRDFRGDLGSFGAQDFFRPNFKRFRRPRQQRRRNNRQRTNRRSRNRCTNRQIRNGRCANLVVTPPPDVVTRRPPTRPTRPRTRAPTRRPTTTSRPVTTPPSGNQDLSTRATNFINADREMIPNLVQMVFHVCVGGCDGCLNLDTPDNKGLRESYPVVKRFCEQSMRSLSLADCIVFMASKAVEIGMRESGSLRRVTVPFTPGRVTCPNPNNYSREFEFPRGDRTDALRFLQDEFGLTRKEAIALMGAHSLGRCRRENSGFDGPWDFTELSLDNGYYKSLVGTEWVVRKISGNTQWTVSTNNNRMMLHADVSLVRNISFRANGEPTCSKAKDCSRNDAVATQVGIYSRNEQEWADDFIQSFRKMCSKV